VARAFLLLSVCLGLLGCDYGTHDSQTDLSEALRSYVLADVASNDTADPTLATPIESIRCDKTEQLFRDEPIFECRIAYRRDRFFLCAVNLGGSLVTELDAPTMPCRFRRLGGPRPPGT
jgi:hypothetical protein